MHLPSLGGRPSGSTPSLSVPPSAGRVDLVDQDGTACSGAGPRGWGASCTPHAKRYSGRGTPLVPAAPSDVSSDSSRRDARDAAGRIEHRSTPAGGRAVAGESPDHRKAAPRLRGPRQLAHDRCAARIHGGASSASPVHDARGWSDWGRPHIRKARGCHRSWGARREAGPPACAEEEIRTYRAYSENVAIPAMRWSAYRPSGRALLDAGSGLGPVVSSGEFPRSD